MMVDVLAHGVSAGTTSVPSEGNNVLLLEDALDVFHGLKKVHTSKSTSGLISVLVVSSEIIDSSGNSYKMSASNTYSWGHRLVFCST